MRNFVPDQLSADSEDYEKFNRRHIYNIGVSQARLPLRIKFRA